MKSKYIIFLIVLISMIASVAFAGVPSKVPLQCYSSKQVTTYNSANGSRWGYISANVDLIQITQISGEWAYGSYPTSKGRISRWFRLSDIVPNLSFGNYDTGMYRASTAYRTEGGSSTIGSVYANDTVTVVYKGGNRSQVIYPVSGGYKMGWVSNNDIKPMSRPTPSPTSNPIVQPVARDTYASITEGDYYLIPEANSNYALDVKGGGAAPAETPLWLYNKNGSDAQIFHIKRVSGDWYIIQHKRTGLVANVQWGNANSGTGIWLYHNDGTASCYWRFIKQSNGSYMIQSMLNSNPIMELQNNSVYTGGRIQLWARHDGQAGKWRLEKVQNNGFQQYSKTAARQVKAYATSSLSSVYGNEWVDKGDTVTVLEETSNAYKVRYPVTNGYKERWVSKDIFTAEPIPNPTNVTYAAYTGVNYKNMGLSQERINCLNKAVKLATIQWTSPATFRTWQASSGGYNTVKAVDGTASQYFISGKTYMGIPYSMNDHTYDDVSWANLVKKGFSQSYMECRYNGRSCTTAHGIDCSYLVYLCFKAAGTNKSISYQTTSTMLNSSYYSKKSLNQIKGGDIFLKNGHVMLYVGRSGSGYAVIEADASDSRVKYNVHSSSKLSSYTVYKFNGFYD